MDHSSRQRRLLWARRWLFIAGVVVMCLIAWFVGKPMIAFMADPGAFREWVRAKGAWGTLIFIGMVIAQVFLAIIPGGPFEIGAGYAYGILRGTLLCDLATTLASVLVFLFVRCFGRGFVELFVDSDRIDRLQLLKSSGRMEQLLFLLFVIPGTPKDVISYLVGLTDIRLSHWIFICGVGRLPAILLSAIGGNAVNSAEYHVAVAVLVILAVLYAAGMLAYHRYEKKIGRPPEDN